MKKRAPFATLPFATVLVIAAFGACDPPPAPASYYEEDFETLCDGAPCWERVGGTPEDATWVETIHPGEHGLRLTNDVVVRGPSGEPAMTNTSGFLSAHVTARCDEGSTLRVDVLMTNDLAQTFAVSAFPIVPSTWENVQTIPLDFTGGTPSGTLRVGAIGIAKSGPGACEVSRIVIDEEGLYDYGC